MSLLSDALALHADRLHEAAGELVTYIRGSNSINVEAVPGESRIESVQPDGTIVEFRTQDFIIKASAIDFGSGAVEPARKDKILRTVGESTITFEVLPDPGIQHFRKLGQYSVAYRILTKEKPS